MIVVWLVVKIEILNGALSMSASEHMSGHLSSLTYVSQVTTVTLDSLCFWQHEPHGLENGLFCCLTAHLLPAQRWLHFSMASGNISFLNVDSAFPAKTELSALSTEPESAQWIPMTQEWQSGKAASSCRPESASSPGRWKVRSLHVVSGADTASQTPRLSMCLIRKHFGSQVLINDIK